MAEEKKKGLSGTTLKILAITLMLMDHVCYIIIDRYLEPIVPFNAERDELSLFFSQNPVIEKLNSISILVHLITRIGFPFFAFLIAEGYDHTRSVKKYALNIAVFALISEIPYNIAFEEKLFAPERQNAMFTLLLGVLCITFVRYLQKIIKKDGINILLYITSSALLGIFCMYVLLTDFWVSDYLKEKYDFKVIFIAGASIIFIFSITIGFIIDPSKRKNFASVVIPMVIFGMCGDIFKTPYGACGVIAITTMNIFKKKRNLAIMCSLFILGLLEANSLFGILAIIPIMEYNGERGAKMNKYFFYALYPVHLILLYLISLIVGISTFSIY